MTPPDPEDLHAARTLLAQLRDPRQNGEHDEIRERHKPRFDGTVNLGHVLTAILMGGALVTMWANSRVAQADHELRIKNLESSNVEFRTTLARLAENESAQLRTQDQLRMSLELLLKDRDRQGPSK